jgi:hypothetical protein
MSRNIEREKWSESSKRSYAYHYDRTTYTDISYVCCRCSIDAVFTGEQQKKAYEVKKNYIWQRRKLCSPCNAELYKLKTKNLALQERWTKEKTSLQRDPAFIAEWLAVIDQFPAFGSRIGSSMGKRLKKLQASVPNPFQMTINIDPPCVKWSTDTSLAILTQDT